MVYDYIIIGAGMGGLAAGLNLADNHKSVLLLEKNSLPGGFVSTFKRGRYEFDTCLYDLYDFGEKDHPGNLRKLFSKYGINVGVKTVPFNTRVKVLDTNEDYLIKGNFEEFVVLLEKLKNGSVDSLRLFIKVIKEIHEALEDIKFKKEISDYPYFNKYMDSNTIDALLDLGMPRDTINRLGYLWIEIGSPLNKLNFIDFAEFMYKIVFKRIAVLTNKNIDMTIKMVRKYQSKDGKLYYNSRVVDIKDQDDLKVVTTSDNLEYKTKHVICDLSKRYVFQNLIKEENQQVNRLENARSIGPNGVVVYLGLNKSAEDLGLENYKYYLYDTLNSEVCMEKMKDINHGTMEVVVPNVVNEEASPKNTCILVLKKIFFKDVFNNVNKNNYHSFKMDIANLLINSFESNFGIDIREFIEVIEVATPFTFKRYTNSINGSMTGYMRSGYDNSIHRLISYDDELVNGLSFVGAYSVLGNGVDNAFTSGIFVTEKLLGDNTKLKVKRGKRLEKNV